MSDERCRRFAARPHLLHEFHDALEALGLDRFGVGGRLALVLTTNALDQRLLLRVVGQLLRAQLLAVFVEILRILERKTQIILKLSGRIKINCTTFSETSFKLG